MQKFINSITESSDHGLMIIISAITIVVGGLLGGLFTMLNTKYKYTLDLKKHSKPMIDKTRVNLALKKNIREIRLEINADRVSMCLYHNGESFISGLKIDKFSMHQEDCAPGVQSISLHVQNLNVSTFPASTYALLFDKVLITEDTAQCPDEAMVELMSRVGCVSFYMFLLEDTKERPLGFITIAYNKKTVLKRDDMLFVQTYLHKFTRLITDNYTSDDIETSIK